MPLQSDIQLKFLRHSPRDGLSIKNEHRFFTRIHLNPWLCLFILLTACLGLMTLYSASGQNTSMVLKQAMSFGIGFAVMFFLAQIPPKIYQALSPFFYVFGLLCLFAVFAFGEVRLGAKRWIGIPGFGSVQPSEFMKIAMPMAAAWMLSRASIPPALSRIFKALLLTLIPFFLIAKQPDLGTSALVLASGIFIFKWLVMEINW